MKPLLRPLLIAALFAAVPPAHAAVPLEEPADETSAPMPATRPTAEDETTMVVIPATDTAALDAAVGKQVVVTGKVKSAEWSRSGKVMAIQFEGAPDGGFQAVLFEKNRKKMDEAYAGDVAKNLVGKQLHVRGRLQMYGGRLETKKGRPEVVISNDSQLTIMDAPEVPGPSTMPSTLPAS